jgi:hypothetical protein
MLRFVTGVRLVFLTVHEDPDIAAEAIRLGESGYLLKSSASGEPTPRGGPRDEGSRRPPPTENPQTNTRSWDTFGVKTSAELVQYALEHGKS